MEVSPCKSCVLGDQDKNNDQCLNCNDRLAYVYSMGDNSQSLPIERTDMTSKNNNGRKAYSPEDKQFLFRNYKTMTNRQLADELGRSPASIAGTLSHYGLLRSGNRQSKNVSDQPGRNQGKLTTTDNMEPALDGTVIKSTYVVIDFEEHGELFESLLKLAKSQYRSPKDQILFLISEAVANG